MFPGTDLSICAAWVKGVKKERKDEEEGDREREEGEEEPEETGQREREEEERGPE